MLDERNDRTFLNKIDSRLKRSAKKGKHLDLTIRDDSMTPWHQALLLCWIFVCRQVVKSIAALAQVTKFFCKQQSLNLDISERLDENALNIQEPNCFEIAVAFQSSFLSRGRSLVGKRKATSQLSLNKNVGQPAEKEPWVNLMFTWMVGKLIK